MSSVMRSLQLVEVSTLGGHTTEIRTMAVGTFLRTCEVISVLPI